MDSSHPKRLPSSGQPHVSRSRAVKSRPRPKSAEQVLKKSHSLRKSSAQSTRSEFIGKGDFSIKGWAESGERIRAGLRSTNMPLSRPVPRYTRPTFHVQPTSVRMSQTQPCLDFKAVDLFPKSRRYGETENYEQHIPSSIEREIEMYGLQGYRDLGHETIQSRIRAVSRLGSMDRSPYPHKPIKYQLVGDASSSQDIYQHQSSVSCASSICSQKETSSPAQANAQVAARTIKNLIINNYYGTESNTKRHTTTSAQIPVPDKVLTNQRNYYPNENSLFRPLTPTDPNTLYRTITPVKGPSPTRISPIPWSELGLSDEDFSSTNISRIDLSASWTTVSSKIPSLELGFDTSSTWIETDNEMESCLSTEEKVFTKEAQQDSSIDQIISTVVKDKLIDQDTTEELIKESDKEKEVEKPMIGSRYEQNVAVEKCKTCESEYEDLSDEDEEGEEEYDTDDEASSLSSDDVNDDAIAREATQDLIKASIEYTEEVKHSGKPQEDQFIETKLETLESVENRTQEVELAKPAPPTQIPKQESSKPETSKPENSKTEKIQPEAPPPEKPKLDPTKPQQPPTSLEPKTKNLNDFRTNIFQASSFKNTEPAVKKSLSSISSYSSYAGGSRWKRFKRRMKKIFCCCSKGDFDDYSYTSSSSEADWYTPR